MAMDYLNYAKDILTLWKIKPLPDIFSAFNGGCSKPGSLLTFSEFLLLETSICYRFLFTFIKCALTS